MTPIVNTKDSFFQLQKKNVSAIIVLDTLTLIRYPIVLQKKLTDNANSALIIANFFFLSRNSPRALKKKKTSVWSTEQKEKVRNINALFALSVSFFCKTTGYLCCTFLIFFCCSNEPKKAHWITRFPFKNIRPLTHHMQKETSPRQFF